MSLRAANRERRRQRILAAARSLIEDGGFDDLSMRALAERAGVSVTTLYNLYGSKDQIRFALVSALIDGIDAVLETIPLARPLERARAVVTVSIEHMVRNGKLCRVGLLANACGPDGIADADVTPRAVEMQRVAIAAAIEEGLLRPDLHPTLLGGQIYDGFRRASLLWAAGLLDADGFRDRALYAFYVCLLGVATEATRPAMLTELAALEARLDRARESAA